MEWQPIETAPQWADRVILWCPLLAKRHGADAGFVTGRMVDASPRGDGMGGDWTFTHWMPLPTPPDGQQPGGAAQGGE